MGNKLIIRLFAGMMLTAAALLPSSCERLENVSVEGFSCSNCFQDKPEWVRLNVTLTVNGENPYVPLTIYIGDFEDNNIDWVDTAYSTSYWVEVRPDRYYSVKAEYKDGSKRVFAIDGDKVKLRQNTTNCDVPCYYQVGGYVDVRLR